MLVSALAFTITAFTFNQTASTPSSTLKVNVTGITNGEGDIHLLIFNKPMGFPTNEEAAYRHIKQKAASGQISIALADLPNGTYSIVAFHDRNGNQRFDKSWFGSPKEDYGFSNIPGEFCGTPSFQQTSFVVSQTNSSITVKLINIK